MPNLKALADAIVVDDSKLKSADDYCAVFAKLAAILLNECDLIVCGKESFRLVEIEVKRKNGWI